MEAAHDSVYLATSLSFSLSHTLAESKHTLSWALYHYDSLKMPPACLYPDEQS